MDIRERLNQATEMVEQARAVPLSASCVVHRGDLLALLDEIRLGLPDALVQADSILGRREEVIEEGRLAAENLLDSARQEAAHLVSQERVVQLAQQEADRIVSEATTESDRVKQEAEEYIDSRLATLEVILTKTMDAVERGRARLAGERDVDQLAETAQDQ
jgi:cell division septum initiation protein DivIVA